MPRIDPACSCPSKRNYRKRSAYAVLGGILIALLPKCHFCVLAYSSAITLCSGAKIYQHSPIWSNYISLGLAIFTFLMIAFNYRGIRTWFALLFVLLGSFLIIQSELWTGELLSYYWGSGLLLTGVWVNGSFYYFFKKLALGRLTRSNQA